MLLIMFHPAIVDANLRHIEATKDIPGNGGKLLRYSVADARAFARGLQDATDPKTGAYTRKITPDEQAYMINETYVCQADWRYWAERYAMIVKGGQELDSLYPLWASQEYILEILSRLQYERRQSQHPDGLLIDVLKARQLGASTMIQSIIGHRTMYWNHTQGLIAADVPFQSLYLFAMCKRTIRQVPGFLRPVLLLQPETGPWTFENGSKIDVESGKSMRGGLREEGGQKGQIGVGHTYSCVHLSEIAKWEYPEQIDAGLMPGVPISKATFMARESTAEGYNYWYQQWKLAEQRVSRFFPVFIPWCIETTKYRLPPPPGWEPSPLVKAHAERVEQTSPQWFSGRTLRLDPDQLYWYQLHHEQAEAGEAFKPGTLADFLENYPADPEEAFQHSGRTVFGQGLIEHLKQFARPVVSALEVQPRSEIHQLRHWSGGN